MTKLFVMAVPVLPGKSDQLKKFVNELKTSRKKEFNESRKSAGVRERTFFQSTPMGEIIIVTLEGENPEQAFQKLSEKNDEFTKWFDSQAKEIHGLDLTKKPESSIPELLVETDPIKEKVSME